MNIHKPFKVTIRFRHIIESPAWIDSNWFKQIEMTQHDEYTELEVNFSVPESEWEIHDLRNLWSWGG